MDPDPRAVRIFAGTGQSGWTRLMPSVRGSESSHCNRRLPSANPLSVRTSEGPLSLTDCAGKLLYHVHLFFGGMKWRKRQAQLGVSNFLSGREGTRSEPH